MSLHARIENETPGVDSRPPHFFTVDVEEYFQVNAFESVISRAEWSRWPLRLGKSLPRLLSALQRHNAIGTFFVLGWVARESPALVRAIADAGHEIASHGFWHRRIPTLTPQEFREDVRTSKTVLEDIAGVPVLGYRAPSFSILPGYEWTFDVLIEEGFRYDSSLFPIRRRGYGYPGAMRVPHWLIRPAGTLAEFPLATASLGGVAIPAAGGGYLRHLPLNLIRAALRQSERLHAPGVFYIHPWEIDPEQPRVPVSMLTRLRHYRGISGAMQRVERLLADFRFASIASGLEALPRPSRGASLAST